MLEDFYLHNYKGSDRQGINTAEMQEAARRRASLTMPELLSLEEAHALFLAAGGGGGKWQIYKTGGVVFGVYRREGQEALAGKQAAMDMLHLGQELGLQELQMPYSSWVGCYAKGQDFSDVNLEGALLCDAMLERCIFADGQLQKADFSRANLRGASFMNADLRGADFENADLSGADFRGALLEGARFPGANLYKVQR